MKNVISLADFKKIDSDKFVLPYYEAVDGIDYLIHVKKHLIEEDYKEVLCGIMDPYIFVELEEDLKQIAANYFHFSAKNDL